MQAAFFVLILMSLICHAFIGDHIIRHADIKFCFRCPFNVNVLLVGECVDILARVRFVINQIHVRVVPAVRVFSASTHLDRVVLIRGVAMPEQSI